MYDELIDEKKKLDQWLRNHPGIMISRIERDMGMYPGTIRLKGRGVPLKYVEPLIMKLLLYGYGRE